MLLLEHVMEVAELLSALWSQQRQQRLLTLFAQQGGRS